MTRLTFIFAWTFAGFTTPQMLASPVSEATSVPEIISKIVPIQYASASDIAALLNGHNGGGQAATKTRFMERLLSRLGAEDLDCEIGALGPRIITCDVRNNSLWVLASPQDLNRIKGVIEKLDIVEGQI